MAVPAILLYGSEYRVPNKNKTDGLENSRN